jgi:hypothetical protein
MDRLIGCLGLQFSINERKGSEMKEETKTKEGKREEGKKGEMEGKRRRGKRMKENAKRRWLLKLSNGNTHLGPLVISSLYLCLKFPQNNFKNEIKILPFFVPE